MTRKMRQDNYKFNVPIVGTDPISKGTFTIEWAWMLWDYDYEEDKKSVASRAQGEILIRSTDDNPLYKIAKESPLRLQGLVASVNFGTEKRFIRIDTISGYDASEDFERVMLNPVTFEILDNLQFLEDIKEYKDWNLL